MGLDRMAVGYGREHCSAAYREEINRSADRELKIVLNPACCCWRGLGFCSGLILRAECSAFRNCFEGVRMNGNEGSDAIAMLIDDRSHLCVKGSVVDDLSVLVVWASDEGDEYVAPF